MHPAQTTTSARPPHACDSVRWGALAILLACAGCASPPSTTPAEPVADRAAEGAEPVSGPAVAEAPADVLRDRAERLWHARLAEDWSTVYEFEDLRGMQDATVERYVEWASENDPFKVHEYQIGRVLSDGPFGWVEVETALSARRFPGAPIRSVDRWEKWQLLDGVWMPVHGKRIDQFPIAPVERDLAAEPQLRERCEAFWAARRDEDWERMVELCEPADREQIGPLMLAEQQGMLKYVDHRIGWVEATGDKARTRVRFVHKLNDPSLVKAPPMALDLIERWVKVDGQWYIDLVGDAQVGSAAPAQQETSP